MIDYSTHCAEPSPRATAEKTVRAFRMAVHHSTLTHYKTGRSAECNHRAAEVTHGQWSVGEEWSTRRSCGIRGGQGSGGGRGRGRETEGRVPKDRRPPSNLSVYQIWLYSFATRD